MAYSHRSYLVITILLSYILLYLFSKEYVAGGVEHARGNRARKVSIARIQLIIGLANIFVYSQLMSYFDDDKFFDHRLKKRCQQLISLMIVCSHIIYFLYYAPRFMQLCIFEVANIIAGFWTNLLGMLAGFYIVSCVAVILEQWEPTRRILYWLTHPSILHNFTFNKKWQLKCSLVVTAICSLLMYYSSDKIVVRHVTFPIRGLSTEKGSSIKFAVVSDIHAGASVYASQVAKVTDAVLDQTVDAVLIVGDMVDGPCKDLASRLDPLWAMPHRFPTFFVTGNHDYYYGDVREWLSLYREKGITVLNNSHALFHGLCLAGVDDISSGKSGVPNHSLNASLAFYDCPAGASRILLSHNPAAVHEIDKDLLSSLDLVISGHTHAGQFYVVFPVVYWLLPYFYGRYDLPAGPGSLFVSAGTLYQGPPMKMLAMSEVWVVTLTKV